MNDPLANCVVQGAELSGVKLGTGKGELVVIGGNCLPPGIHDIEQGTMFATLAWSPVDMSHNAADAANKVLDGQPVLKNQSGAPAIITKAKLAKYKSECTFSAGWRRPFSIPLPMPATGRVEQGCASGPSCLLRIAIKRSGWAATARFFAATLPPEMVLLSRQLDFVRTVGALSPENYGGRP